MAERTFKLSDNPQRSSSIRVRGRPFEPHKDLYHYVLFAATYRLQPQCISGVHDFEAAFYFSVQTMATIGYGTFAPATRFGHVLVTFEAITGVFATAMVTGITFAKFARPIARVMFARKVVVAPRNGVPHLMFRLANARNNTVVEAQLRVTVLVNEKTREGEVMRRQIDVPLVRPQTSLFFLSWTAMHEISEKSPFYGPNAFDELRAKNAEILLSMSGLDDTISQTIHARYRYALDDVIVGHKFKDVISTDEDGARRLDYGTFHEVVALDDEPPV